MTRYLLINMLLGLLLVVYAVFVDDKEILYSWGMEEWILILLFGSILFTIAFLGWITEPFNEDSDA